MEEPKMNMEDMIVDIIIIIISFGVMYGIFRMVLTFPQ
jgi:hypothetical protein